LHNNDIWSARVATASRVSGISRPQETTAFSQQKIQSDTTWQPDAVSRLGARCRFCAAPLTHSFVDLGMSPLCQTHIEAHQLGSMERFYPLHALVCDRCWLVQLQEFVAPADIFSEYAYFSSYSDSWVAHARRYADKICTEYGIGPGSLVVEIASNDGLPPATFRCTGCACCRSPVGEQRARTRPGPNDFVAGMKMLLAPGGMITMEFPHFLRLIEGQLEVFD
jgi:hypothetical protein